MGARPDLQEEKGIFANSPPFSKAIRGEESERGLVTVIPPRAVGQRMDKTQLFCYRQSRRERIGAPRRTALQL